MRRSLVVLLITLGFTAGCSGSQTAKPAASASSKSASASAKFDGRTSCHSVMYIGESTSIGMVTPLQIPTQDERLQGRMRAVGVADLHINVSGGRSTFERLLDRPNAMDVLTREFTKKFTGCHVIALGVNDAANSSFAQSAGTARQRIDRILGQIGDRPVLWPEVSTRPSLTGPYANANMNRFDAELRAATKRYPKLRLYDWPTEMDPQWREGDGIHDVRRGSRARAAMYASALAVAFPQHQGANPSAVVGSVWGSPPSPKHRPALPAVAGDDQSFWAGDTKALKLYTN